MTNSSEKDLHDLLIRAAGLRSSMSSPGHQTAYRLFNGFYEGNKDLVVDVYGRTLVIFCQNKDTVSSANLVRMTYEIFLNALPWIKCVIVKNHNHPQKAMRCGEILFGGLPDERIDESGVKYSVDLLVNQDAGFYLDTRNLRAWLLEHSAGMDVLNTFAYTGSLGVAALAGGARQVMQMDLNRRFLEAARKSAELNRLDTKKMKLAPVDFFVGVSQLKRSGNLFDLVILDPPFFSVTDKGKVDQAGEGHRLINKVRPLVKDGGRVVAINNSLFLRGAVYLHSLEELSKDGYVAIEEIIPVPEDITGFSETVQTKPPLDPAPFNHPTKIVILKIKRK